MIAHINAMIDNVGRKVVFDGREHIAAPVIILVEGVHRGSGGPLYYPASVLEASAQFWNGMPVPVQHPEMNGSPISCNSPDVIERQTVGRLWNVRYEPTPKPRLKGEIYVDVNKAKKISPSVLDALNNNSPLEVSTGLFSNDEHISGKWNDEDYVAVVKDIRPDHLALLPGARGACSWKDGCGVRANQDGGGDGMKDILGRLLSFFKPITENVEQIQNTIKELEQSDGGGENNDEGSTENKCSGSGKKPTEEELNQKAKVNAAMRAAKIYSNANPYHDKGTGQFTSGPGGGGSGGGHGSSQEFGAYRIPPSSVHVRKDISTSKYQFSYGKKPRGEAQWGFVFKGDGGAEHTYFVQGRPLLFSESSKVALKKAREWAASQGSTSVTIEAAS